MLRAVYQLRPAGLAQLVQLGDTLHSWAAEIAAMWRFTRNNGITEGFHTKMEVLQRQAYGFRNFENYRQSAAGACPPLMPKARVATPPSSCTAWDNGGTMRALYAGTSGFAYPAWRPGFYPDKLPQSKFLAHYADRLNAVEINYTFRRTPPLSTLERWVETTPPGFVFALKAHQRITHVRRLEDAGAATEFFFKAIDPLRSARRLGPVLFQLPPNLKCDLETLRAFLMLLPGDIRCAMEFRHPSWLVPEVYDLLQGAGVSLCVAESDKFETPEAITANFVYYRLRKPQYSPAELDSIAARSREMVAAGRDLFLFLKHEEDPSSALNAEKVLRAQASVPKLEDSGLS